MLQHYYLFDILVDLTRYHEQFLHIFARRICGQNMDLFGCKENNKTWYKFFSHKLAIHILYGSIVFRWLKPFMIFLYLFARVNLNCTIGFVGPIFPLLVRSPKMKISLTHGVDCIATLTSTQDWPLLTLTVRIYLVESWSKKSLCM